MNCNSKIVDLASSAPTTMNNLSTEEGKKKRNKTLINDNQMPHGAARFDLNSGVPAEAAMPFLRLKEISTDEVGRMTTESGSSTSLGEFNAHSTHVTDHSPDTRPASNQGLHYALSSVATEELPSFVKQHDSSLPFPEKVRHTVTPCPSLSVSKL